jgi:MoaA/NifB/PqqE/SkfB family radical SAM enzyme
MSILSIGSKALYRIFVPGIAKANLALTFRCNHKCATCNIWKTHGYNLTKDSRWKDAGELTVDEIEKFTERNNLIYLSLTGGETFLRKDIEEIVKVCSLHVPMLTITSNGSMPEKIEKVARNVLPYAKGIININISLDGNKEQHDKFTGVPGSYEKAVESIDRLATIKNSKLRISIETLVSTLTNGGREYVQHFAEERKLPITYSIIQKAPFYDNESINIGCGELPKIKASLNPHDIFSALYIRSARNGHSPKCVAGQYTCSITPYGDIMPCLFLPVILKNLRESDYRIGKLDYKEAVKSCQSRCWTPCEAYPTIMFRPWRIL